MENKADVESKLVNKIKFYIVNYEPDLINYSLTAISAVAMANCLYYMQDDPKKAVIWGIGSVISETLSFFPYYVKMPK